MHVPDSVLDRHCIPFGCTGPKDGGPACSGSPKRASHPVPHRPGPASPQDVEQASDLLALTMPDVDGLLFFANRTRLLRRLRSGTLPILVDVSPGRGSPSIMRDGDSAPLERTLYDYAAKLAELLDHFGWSPCSLELPQPRPRTLMPAVTALLAGYPIAYVTSSETGDTCLARVPLHLVRVSASIAQGEPRHVFSFTFPAADGDGGDEMMRRVGQWDEELRTMAAEGVELSIERSTVVHDQVVM
ncbi:hypothetical protein DFJ74DRAFT_424549 [Hyaloraphidium curvatum]|nr:hypothetical protein DFJ74DRAFT_424549 [Hyaloraphidium curvatum]